MRSKSTIIKMPGNSRRDSFKFIILVALIVLVSCVTIWNAMQLQTSINRTTQTYVSDVSLQLANDIDHQLIKNIQNLNMLGEYVSQIYARGSFEDITRYLTQNVAPLGFTSLMLLHQDGGAYSTSPLELDISTLGGVQASFRGQSGVSLFGEQSILYSVPVYLQEELIGVLAGVRNKANMQALIQSDSFSGDSLNCIINQNGKVIISPTDLEPFLRLDDIFNHNDNSGTMADIRQMQENMYNAQSGVFTFTAVNGEKLVLSYQPLDSYGWVLLTLVPADLISHETNAYIHLSFVIIAGTIFLFLLILSVSVRSYQNHYKQLEYAAFTDEVTGGMNNAAFQLRCHELFKMAGPACYTIAVLNLKDFKLINESFGSTAGNQTLQHIMNVLRENIGAQEAAARGDADNFYLCLKQCDCAAIEQRLSGLIEKINAFNEGLAEPYYLEFRQGAYIVDNLDMEVTVMQDRARTASRTVPAQHDGECAFYDTRYTQILQHERELNSLFESSLKKGDFVVFLQPKVWTQSGGLGGAEALVRWLHPQRGMISPADFIPLFERNGRICQIDLYVFEQVCKMMRHRIDMDEELFPVSVNLSRQHFSKEGCLAEFAEIARQYQIPEGMIEIELTESIFFDDRSIERVKAEIQRMHQYGFLCSLDDFGAGYSSLGLLMEFDVDAVKLDWRFFLNIARPKTKEVVSAIVDLSKRLGMRTVAEGIETQEQLEFVHNVGCDMVQGYIYSRPLPIAEFEAWIAKRRNGKL